MKLGKYIKEYSVRNKQLRDIPVYSVTNSVGLTRPEEYFNKTIHSEDLRNYKIVKRNMIAFNPVNIKIGSVVVQDAEDEVLVSPLYTVFEVDTTKLDPYYVVAFLRSPSGLQKVLSKTTGSVRIVLKYSGLCDIDIPMPSLAEQRHIVQCLNAVQESIDRASHRMVLYDKLVKSRFIELFDVQKCQKKTLGECTDFVDYRGHTPELSDAGTIRMVNAKSVGKGFFKYVDEYVTEETYDSWMHRGFGYPGDILFVTEGHTFGNTCLIPNDLKKFALGQRVITIKGHQEVLNAFLCSYMQTDMFWKDINVYRTGGTAQGIRSKDLVKVYVPIPPLEQQKQFAAFVEQTDKSKLATTETLKFLDELKAALMSQYFG